MKERISRIFKNITLTKIIFSYSKVFIKLSFSITCLHKIDDLSDWKVTEKEIGFENEVHMH